MADEELNKTINGLDPISSLSLETEFPVWDSLDEDTKKATLQQVKDLIAEGIVAGVSFVGTRAQYETAKLIPAGEEGYIPDSSLVIITDENRTYVTSGTGSEQTLTLIARVMSAGDGITITDDVIKADTVTFTGSHAEWNALTPAQKAKYNIVNFTDDLECAYQDIYSTTEVKTNKVWYDANGVPHDVYRITVIKDTSSSGVYTVSLGLTNYNLISLYGAFSRTDANVQSPLPYSNIASLNMGIMLYIENGDLKIYKGTDWNNVATKNNVTIEYTKTTD